MEVKRGEVYYLKFNDAIGSEQSVGRPAVVVSSDKGNETSPVVIVCYLTKQKKGCDTNVPVVVKKAQGWVLCNQIFVADKSRLINPIQTLTKEEMSRVDEGLKEALGLISEEETKEDPRIEILRLQNELTTYRMLYDMALKNYTELKFAKDTVPPVVMSKMEPVVAKAEPVVEKKEDSIHKVNINICGWKDLADIGVPKSVTYSVTGTRKKLGRFETVDELLLCDRFTERHLEKFRDKLEV